MAKGERIVGLEVARGIAACLVVLHHIELSFEHFFEQTAFTQYWSFGFIGIDFFFVLSGFIIYTVHSGDAPTFFHWKKYLLKRFVRVFIPYWPVGIVMFLSYALFPALSEGERNIGIFPTFFLLPSEGRPALSVAWTLIHEIIFYAFFSVFFFMGKKGLAFFMCAWCVAIFGGHISSITSSNDTAGYLLGMNNLQFILGIIAAIVVKKTSVQHTTCLVILFIGILAVIGFSLILPIVQITQPIRVIGMGLIFCLIVFALAGIEYKTQYNRFLLLLGSASYSIYLIHNPLISILSRLVRYFRDNMNTDIIFLVIFILCIFAGFVYHFLWERPSMLKVKNLLLN